MKTVVINLLGGCGLGKSTTAALIFGELKLADVNVELVREYPKEWAWQGKKILPEHQIELYEEQLRREEMLYNKVAFIVTDSPLLLNPMYEKFYSGKDPIAERVFNHYEEVKKREVQHLNFLLRRNKAFKEEGRFEKEDTARQIDAFLENYLKEKNVNYVNIPDADRERVNKIMYLARTFRGIV